jgi:anti-sigma B factor antagonist
VRGEVCTHQREVRTVQVEGDLTVRTAASQKPKLLAALRAPYSVVELDLAEVTEIDTSGVQLLLLGCNIAMVVGGALRLTVISPAVREVIELLQLQTVFAQAAAHCPACAGRCGAGRLDAAVRSSG